MHLDLTTAIQLTYALGVGLLIGLERSFGLVKKEGVEPVGADDALDDGATGAPATTSGAPDSAGEAPDPEATAQDGTAAAVSTAPGEQMGVRTFTVLALTGFAAAVVGERLSLVAPITLGLTGLLIIAMYFRASELGVGITTEAAAFCSCVLGMLCRVNYHVAAVLAVVVTTLLASKRWTHSTVRKMRRIELTDTLKFLVIILVVLPLLPDRALDPYGAFNPYKVGVLVVLISGISFAGYFLTRILGAQKGLGLTGIVGGLTSSTAVTAAMAGQAKRAPQLSAICAVSTIAANATMFCRVLVVVAVLDLPLLKRLAWSVGGMAVTAAVATIVLWLWAARAEEESSGDGQEIPLKNPFSLGPALKFAAFFVFIIFALKLAKLYLGDQGLYAAATLSGLADVDAITLSIAEQAHAGDMIRRVGAIAITIAVVSNSATKTGIAIYGGGWKFGRLVAICLGAATVVGLALAFVV